MPQHHNPRGVALSPPTKHLPLNPRDHIPRRPCNHIPKAAPSPYHPPPSPQTNTTFPRTNRTRRAGPRTTVRRGKQSPSPAPARLRPPRIYRTNQPVHHGPLPSYAREPSPRRPPPAIVFCRRVPCPAPHRPCLALEDTNRGNATTHSVMECACFRAACAGVGAVGSEVGSERKGNKGESGRVQSGGTALDYYLGSGDRKRNHPLEDRQPDGASSPRARVTRREPSCGGGGGKQDRTGGQGGGRHTA
ncbi:uncharacterized protein B0H64DRAFT_85833 [Chaetomium fimeti]|uniref:Uncharacterized protein n=1 Tax=Chaetomium fimeti TaxID=1854472 RepID=A0AAE0HLU5_9PEZI|nr:hypothetical protein B0H64DRAFT_85833 [Chaetomium fimeti]